MAGDSAVANDDNIEIIDIIWCVPSFDHSYDDRIIVHKRLKKRIVLL